ncbi:uncharacterized protein LOC141718220 [Apium graveolens]|uniref:uncharacterized protein LOC141718220 n=1 Tax=Apium graveolens TaxID=4045 RepID=UPI003D795388
MALSGVVEEMKKHYADLRRFGAWKEGCRPVLGLDGCFLKTVCGGQLLLAVGRDENNSIFSVAMVVVESESYDSWKWFLMMLGDDLDFQYGYAHTFISDQQKGLLKAVKELFPHAEHRNCTRHIYSNLQGKHASEAVRNALFEASTATQPQAFKSAMKDLAKALKKAFDKMNELEPKVWSKAYFETHCKIDSTENNIPECFNSWILRSRYMPIINMLTEIHDMIMKKLHEKRDAMKPVDCIVLPRIKRILDDCVKESTECSVLWDGNTNFQVKWRGIGFCVNWMNKLGAIGFGS